MTKELTDLRMVKTAVMVHPEIEGTLRIDFHPNSYDGVVHFKGKAYESSLKILLLQGWIHLERPDFSQPGR
jgi:hypothetical protein